MSTTSATHANDTDRAFPPIGWLSTIALGCVIIGGILLASYAPRVAPQGIATALLVAGVLALASAWVLLLRLRDFAWGTFGKVFKWALPAYAVTSGMIELAFVRDHTRGSSLVIVSLMLVVFALSVPTTIAFTTARYAEPS